ncbi:MAG: hypothetical protein KF887_16985 [Paracoccaceae bacterium]|nr:MAG: hypothetical protein KF887_16985 [Paracoccaceae bacterium]
MVQHHPLQETAVAQGHGIKIIQHKGAARGNQRLRGIQHEVAGPMPRAFTKQLASRQVEDSKAAIIGQKIHRKGQPVNLPRHPSGPGLLQGPILAPFQAQGAVRIIHLHGDPAIGPRKPQGQPVGAPDQPRAGRKGRSHATTRTLGTGLCKALGKEAFERAFGLKPGRVRGNPRIKPGVPRGFIPKNRPPRRDDRRVQKFQRIILPPVQQGR